MPVNYAEVMRDLEAREGKLLSELNTVRAAKPAIALLIQAQQADAALAAPRGRYATMGATAAIRDLFSRTDDLLTREEIAARLRAEGWTSEASNPLSSLSATLSQMRDYLDKVEDRWRRKQNPSAWVSREQMEAIAVSPPAPNSFAANHPVLSTVQKQLDELSAVVSQE